MTKKQEIMRNYEKRLSVLADEQLVMSEVDNYENFYRKLFLGAECLGEGD